VILGRRELDWFQLLLLESAERTLLPEIYEVFGAERTYAFLEMFAGMVVRVPEAGILSRAARGVELYRCMCGGMSLAAGVVKVGLTETEGAEVVRKLEMLLLDSGMPLGR
jgi:hypothetical protein